MQPGHPCTLEASVQPSASDPYGCISIQEECTETAGDGTESTSDPEAHQAKVPEAEPCESNGPNYRTTQGPPQPAPRLPSHLVAELSGKGLWVCVFAIVLIHGIVSFEIAGMEAGYKMLGEVGDICLSVRCSWVLFPPAQYPETIEDRVNGLRPDRSLWSLGGTHKAPFRRLARRALESPLRDQHPTTDAILAAIPSPCAQS